MRTRLAACVSALAVVVPVAVAAAGAEGPAAPAHAVAGLPDDAPPALYRPEPRLPAPHGWPGPEAFSRTSGTGRLAGGGLFWTDYLYDDHGTTAPSVGEPSVTAGSPSFGTYTYPDGPAHGNGADIFRAAVLQRGDTTYWRVDWNTLADPKVPIAQWMFDTDDKASTGTASWGVAGLTSPGNEAALLVSSRGALLYHLPAGPGMPAPVKSSARLPVTVDRTARSFVVAVPGRLLRPSGTWRIRLAAGLADPTGTGFAQPPDAGPGQPRVYNVAFRAPAQEPPANNFWNDMAQTAALRNGDVTGFSTTVRWADLAHHRTTSEQQPKGWSDRWYASSVDLGAGMVGDPSTIEDGEPNYLGRVQPYAVYVPASYDPRRPAPLTFLLHSLTQNHNQYAATTPQFAQLACEQRRSICVTTLGRGPDGMYHGVAELDFWEVWREVAKAFRLDPERTVLAGYSMGGIGTNQLAMAHPDLFARAVTLAGGVGDVPALENLRWLPTYLAGGAQDELVWATTQKAEADALDSFGYRYRWVLYPAMDHVAFELADKFADAAAYMGNAHRERRPWHVTFRWTPKDTENANDQRLTQGGIAWTQRPDLGVGTTGAYWLRDLRARSTSTDARLDARSGLLHVELPTVERNMTVDPTVPPEPAMVTTVDWSRGAVLPPSQKITLHLTNVEQVRLVLRDAGFRPGTAGMLDVTTDGSVTVRLGNRTVRLPAGHHLVPFTA